jgi:hypothetical protein
MGIKHIWSIACNKAVVDQQTNVLSLQDTLENLNVSLKGNGPTPSLKNPVNIPVSYDIVSFWELEDAEKMEAKVSLFSPEGKEINTIDTGFESKKSEKTYRTIIKVNGFPLVGSGRYTLKVKQKIGDSFKEVAEIPIFVFLNMEIVKETNF